MPLPKYNDEVGGYVIAGKKDPANVTHDGRKGGLFHGKTHQDEGGGIKAVVDNAKPILVETGEVIINKNSSKKYWKLLSKINQAGGGVPIAPPDGASADTDEDPDETFKTGGKVSNIDFNANKLPKASVIKLAKEVRANHPDLWNKYAKVYGNAAFNNLLMAFERGYWEDNEQWMYNKWINYTSAHSNAKTIADVIGLLKWGGVADEGVPFMRKVILGELAKEGTTKPAAKETKKAKEVSKPNKITPYSSDIKAKDSYRPKLNVVKSFKTEEGSFDIHDIEKGGAMGRADMFTVFGMVKNVFTNTLKNESDFVKYLPETGDSFYFYKHKDGYFIFRLGEGIYDPDKICIGKDVTWYDISKDELSIDSLAKTNIYGFASVNLFKSVEDFQGAVSTYEYYLNEFTQKEPYQLTFYYNYYPEKDGSNFDVEGFAENTLSIALRDIDYALEAEYFHSNYIPVTNEETVYLKNISEYAPEYAKGGNANQLNAGIKEEKEHIETLKDVYEHKITPKEGVKEIALKHLEQDPEYYNKLQDHLDKSTVVYANGGVVEQVFSFTTPTGNPSKLSYLQQVLVRTAAFKKFFGDWESAAMSYIQDGMKDYEKHFKNVSKAIDRDTLEPQVQYHGTAAKEEFFQFDVTMQKGYGRPYAYFAVNRQYSENFTNFSQGSHSNAQQVLFSVFVRAMNPFRALGHDFVDKMENASYWLDVIKGVIAYDKYNTKDKRNADVKQLSKVIDDQIKRYFDNFDSQEKFPFWLLMARDNGADFKSFLVSHGYDSVFYAENFTTIYDVSDPSQFTYATTIFAPNQVKLADGRNLDFDLFSPDVRMEEGGNLKSGTKEPEKEFDYVMGRYEEGGNIIDSPASIEIMDNEVNDNKNKLFADFMASVIK